MALSIEKDVFPQQFSTNVRVLVIDHDINHLNTIEKMCSQFNYPVKTCSKISEALNLLLEKKDCFDLVLIDAQMPNDMDSYDFVEYVTQQINIPVIMMCVDETISDAKKAIENGACIYWIKPLSENQIKYMWKYVAMKIWNEKRIQETIEGECMKKKEKGEKNKDKDEPLMAKFRVVWTPELHKKFVRAVEELSIDKAVPMKILDKMDVAGLTREQIASHLQKFRIYLREREAEKQQQIQNQNQNAIILKSPLCPGFSHAIEQQNLMSYCCSSSQQVPNHLIARNFPYHFNNIIWQQLPPPESNNTLPPQEHHRQINNSSNDVHQTSPASDNQQIPTTQALPMSSSTIGANIGDTDINGNITRAEEAELDSINSLQEDVVKPKEGTIVEECESDNKVKGTDTENVQGMNSVTNNGEKKEPRRGMRSRKPNTMLKDYVRE